MSLLIKNARILRNGKFFEANILIKKGKIAKVSNKELKADKNFDAKGNLAMPGAIDAHVHMREPGLIHKEDFSSGSMAAAKGGITTFLDMPNTVPPTITASALEEKRNLAKKSVVNFGFNFGAAMGNVSQIKAAKNIAAVKLYMDHTTGDMKITDFDAIKDIFKASRMTIIHAEDISVKNAIDIIIKNRIKNRLHVAHCSSEEELHYAKKNPIKSRVSVEVTPHHLFMTKDSIQELGAFAEMKPGLKTEKDRAALWHGIKAGDVDIIATDHAPHLKEEKQKADYPFGIPGLETMLPLMFNAHHEGKIELSKIIELCCENPAKIFKIKNKGFLKEGFDADITIVDLHKRQAVREEDLLTKCRWSPWEGKILKGWPVATIVNGNIVFENGQINDVRAKEVEYG